MKFRNNRIIKSIAIIGLITVIYSCNQDEFLDKQNPNAITATNYWENESHFTAGLTTAYGALQFQSLYGYGLTREMSKSDEVGGDEWNAATLTFSNMSYTDNDQYIVEKWQDLYVGIFRANQVIDNLTPFDGSNFVSHTKEQILAEAKFLRAFYYFELVHTYGKAVINLSSTNIDFNKAASSIADVTSQVIIPDLEYAKANLPKAWISDHIGRATWGAATAMLGKTYLYQKDWTLASAEFKEIIDEGIYSLVSDPADNFRDDVTHNSESIFEVAFDGSVNPSSSTNVVDDNPWSTGTEATNISKNIAPQIVGGWSVVLPTYNIIEMFHRQEVDPSLGINSSGNTLSKRMAASVTTRVDDNRATFFQQPMSFYTAQEAFLNRHHAGYIIKHTNWLTQALTSNDNRSSINFKIIRYADVLLMQAEALANLNNANDAIKYVDMVRSRAGVLTLQSYITATGTFPAFHRSAQVNGGVVSFVAPTAENVLTHIQRVERYLEFAFEGNRWKDLVRWGIASQVITDNYNDEEWRKANESSILGKTNPPLYLSPSNGSIRSDFLGPYNAYVLSANQSGLNYYPLPSPEVQTNSSITN